MDHVRLIYIDQTRRLSNLKFKISLLEDVFVFPSNCFPSRRRTEEDLNGMKRTRKIEFPVEEI